MIMRNISEELKQFDFLKNIQSRKLEISQIVQCERFFAGKLLRRRKEHQLSVKKVDALIPFIEYQMILLNKCFLFEKNIMRGVKKLLSMLEFLPARFIESSEKLD